LKKYCQDTANSPTAILQRLNEYVHNDAFPPFLKKTTFDYAKGSSSKLATVTKYILADAVRASLYKQTCLGNNNASQALKSTKATEDSKIIQNIASTFVQWEDSLGLPYPLEEIKTYSQEQLQKKLQGFVRETHEGWKEAPNLYFEYVARDLVRDLSQKYYSEFPVSFSVAIFATNAGNNVLIFNPHRAIVVNAQSKNSTTGAEYKDTAIITWVGLKEDSSHLKDRLTNAKNGFKKLLSPWEQGTSYNKKSYQCFSNEKAVANVARGQYDGSILNADAAAVITLAKGVIVGEGHSEYENIYYGYSCVAGRPNYSKEETSTIVIVL